jgi:hypothetical protein
MWKENNLGEEGDIAPNQESPLTLVGAPRKEARSSIITGVWGRAYTRGIQMGRDTPLGKRKNHVEGERKKSLMECVRTDGGDILGEYSEKIHKCEAWKKERKTDETAYFGVPDAGRDGVWIPAQTNADRTSAVTG